MALPRRRMSGRKTESSAAGADVGLDWRALYEVENPAEVDAYIRAHPALAPILADASAHIHRLFPDAAQPIVRHEPDVDGDEPLEALVVNIPTHLQADAAHARLVCLDEQWWLTVLPRLGRDRANLVFVPRFL